MAYPELFLTLALWVAICCIVPHLGTKEIRWYKNVIRFYGKKKKRFEKSTKARNLDDEIPDFPSHKSKKGFFSSSPSSSSGKKKSLRPLPKVPIQFFTILWPLLLLAVGISLYLYIPGNCQFYKPRHHHLDDESDDINNVRGWNVLVFSVLTIILNIVYANQFFKARRFMRANFILVIMIALSAIVLWCIGSTDPCDGDHMNNRFWISFGLYLVYTLWLLCAFFITLLWGRALGATFEKSHPNYLLFKHNKQCHRLQKKKRRFPTQHLAFYPSHSDLHAVQYGEEMQQNHIVVSGMNCTGSSDFSVGRQ